MGLILLIIVLLVLFGGGGIGYYGGHSWGGPGLGLGAIFLIILVVLLVSGRL